MSFFGQSFELVIGRGILTWKHRDRKIGLIRSSLLTQKIELNLDAEQGVITASRIEGGTTEELDIRKIRVIHDETIFIFKVKNTRVLRDELENIIEQIDAGSLEMNEAVHFR